MFKKYTICISLFFVLSINVSAQNIPTNELQLWLSVDKGVTQSGGSVSNWDDQSGNNSYAEQPDDALKPKLKTNAVNGLPAIEFDGVDDYMTFFLPDTINGLTEMSIFIVTANTQDSATGGSQAESAAIFWNETTSWGTVYVSPYQRTIAWRFGTTQTGNRQIYTRPTPIGSTFSLTAMIKNNDIDTLYVNGVLADQQGGKKVDLDGHQEIGQLGRGYNDNTYYPGMIAETLVYIRALSDSERAAVDSYLLGKYALGTTGIEWEIYE